MGRAPVTQAPLQFLDQANQGTDPGRQGRLEMALPEARQQDVHQLRRISGSAKEIGLS
jgi:hypothetical protein